MIWSLGEESMVCSFGFQVLDFSFRVINDGFKA
jgi:hypothetical protein